MLAISVISVTASFSGLGVCESGLMRGRAGSSGQIFGGASSTSTMFYD